MMKVGESQLSPIVKIVKNSCAIGPHSQKYENHENTMVKVGESQPSPIVKIVKNSCAIERHSQQYENH